MIVWDYQDYLKEASKQLEDKEVYLEVPNDPSVLVTTIFKSYEKTRKHEALSQDTLNYHLARDPKFVRFYLLCKIYNRLYDVHVRQVISNCGFYTESISSFLDFHLQHHVHKIKSFKRHKSLFVEK